ncbi:MAG TPA: phenylalanine--tRNA ligase subunit beta, partial [Methylophilaceae bacterium]
MQFSEQWLRSLVNPPLSTEALGDLLTMAGLELEELRPVAAAFSNVVVAQVLSVEKHPDADKLKLCQVAVGQAAPLQIVCGASNVAVGLKVPCALVGAKLPGIEISQAKVRGIESFGMLCSSRELGITEEASGLMVLPEDAPVGAPIREYLGLDDQLLTLKLTPNRADCLSLTGIAREVSALTATALNLPDISPVAPTHNEQREVVLDASQACPRYCGRIISGIDATRPTPDWMRQRIERSGLRCISALVDITNYVMLELGQPLHAFDNRKLQGSVHVRWAKSGEQLKLLNEQLVKLDTDTLLIADDSHALALAGVMGGADSAVSDATTEVFLESAFFLPTVIAGKARELGFSSDASYRFERGVDFNLQRGAIERATQLVVEICGGKPGSVTEAVSAADLPQRLPVTLRTQRADKVLGIVLGQATIARMLRESGFEFTQHGDDFVVNPPSHRFDIEIEEDLIEELARLHGYNNIPPLPPIAALNMLPQNESLRNAHEIRALLAARDFQEVVTYSFVEAAWERDLSGNANPIKLANPIASNMSVMRSSIFGGLLDTLTFNLNRQQERVRLFEIGACFTKDAANYAQKTKLSGLCYGDADSEQWGVAARKVDFFDVKADIEALLGPSIRFVAATHPALHPGQCARVFIGDAEVGVIGVLHPRWQQQYGLQQSVVMFELELQAVLKTSVTKFSEIAKFPPLRRDIAVVVDEAIPAQNLIDAMRQANIPAVSEIALFDVYRGKGIEEHKKSLAFLVLMQDTQKTLMDQDADSAVAKLVDLLSQKFGAVLRN